MVGIGTEYPTTKRAPRFAFEQALRRVELPPRARQTGLVIATHMDGTTGVAVVGQRRLAAVWGVGRKRLAADLAPIIGAGLLEVEARSAAHGTQRYRSRCYWLTTDLYAADGAVRLDASTTDATAASSSGDALADGDTESASSSGDALETAHSIAASSSGDALADHAEQGQRVPFDSQRVPFDVQRVPQGTQFTTSHPHGSEGVGVVGPLTAPGLAEARPVAAPASPAIEAAVATTLDRLDAELSERNLRVPRHHQPLLDHLRRCIGGGWPAGELVARILDEPLPRRVERIGSLITHRAGQIATEPDAAAIAAANNDTQTLADYRQLVTAITHHGLPVGYMSGNDYRALADADALSVTTGYLWMYRDTMLARAGGDLGAVIDATCREAADITPAELRRDMHLIGEGIRNAARSLTWPAAIDPERLLADASTPELIELHAIASTATDDTDHAVDLIDAAVRRHRPTITTADYRSLSASELI